VIRRSIGTWWYIEKDKGWIPAFAESTPRIEEHLASWTKGCEGLIYSGVLKRNALGDDGIQRE